MARERIIDAQSAGDEDDTHNLSSRPASVAQCIGQKELLDRLTISIRAARQRNEPLDHVLLHGPPGLGKTTLAYVIATELQVGIRATSGPVLERPGAVAAILTNLEDRDVL